MDKVRFLMSDTSADVTAACREALEQKGVEVTVVEKDGLQVLQKMLVVQLIVIAGLHVVHTGGDDRGKRSGG